MLTTPETEACSDPKLDADLWVGKPRPDLAARSARVLVPIGLTFLGTGLMFSAMVGVIIARWMLVLGLPFVVLGIYLIGAPRRARKRANATEYRVTESCLIVRRPKGKQGLVEERFAPPALEQVEAVEQGGDGVGDLVVFLRDEAAGEGVSIARRVFEGIDGVREVAALARLLTTQGQANTAAQPKGDGVTT